jgi:hypothetical protein
MARLAHLCSNLYLNNIKDWMEKFFTVHSFIRNTISWYFPNRKPSVQVFDEQNIKTLNNTFGQMAILLLYNTIDIID